VDRSACIIKSANHHILNPRHLQEICLPRSRKLSHIPFSLFTVRY